MSDKDLSAIIAEVREALQKVAKAGPYRNADDWLNFRIESYRVGQIRKGDTADGIVTILNNLPALLAALEQRTEALQAVQNGGHLGNHGHWDHSMRHGLGCAICIDQRTIAEVVRAALTTPVQSPLGDGSERGTHTASESSSKD